MSIELKLKFENEIIPLDDMVNLNCRFKIGDIVKHKFLKRQGKVYFVYDSSPIFCVMWADGKTTAFHNSTENIELIQNGVLYEDIEL